ncbi:peptide deformylase [Latilactobacillus fuchuensis]|uniref:Def2 protein n=1 Tax=Latilactobacillus fuchuensis DSM 14340 = JCM 11249 TaxID=1423747 RepID=A0A0R1RXB6_9LACO|nr:peptide deformylase [Latilactobacillus fuchuensis]KRL61687.1 def2 protein [Latilactobacillus fuchuensis DSM 14340 = JCM 11249]
MIKPIMHDPTFLAQTATLATVDDKQVITDLLDTLAANTERCVGMAANMIGVNKRIIVCQMGPITLPLVNPTIIKKSAPYETEEGCLSLTGQRATTRYDQITVRYQDRQFKTQEQAFTGWIAQIIQHEVDHCEGILI